MIVPCFLVERKRQHLKLKELSGTLGKGTIGLDNISETQSNANSYGLNYPKTGKELISQDEIMIMDGNKCIFTLRGADRFGQINSIL